MAVKAPPTDPKKKTVWIACRATPNCPGNQAIVVFSKRHAGGGSNTRYRCTVCNRTFHIGT